MKPDEKQRYLKLYNTETREKNKIISDRPLTMYTCGPTVYDYAHIGNFRTYVFEDLLRRVIQYFGFEIKQVMNITDVDDKTIKGAIAAGKSLDEYTKPYIDAFFEDLSSLNCEKVEVNPRATETIPEMIDMIQKLMDEGIAYQGQDRSVYFSIDKFPSYGRLSHLDLDDLKVNASQQNADEYDKDNCSDFVLWKAYDGERDGTIFWESPWGKGRPGWHLECSAMAMKHLGDTIDIHVGGVDNIFPHHENEIAQSEACSHKQFVKHWLHAEHLLVDGKKMSKSLGNFYTLRDLIAKGFSGRDVRFALMQTHYRMQLNFTLDALQAAKNSLRRLDDFVSRLLSVSGNAGDTTYQNHLSTLSEKFNGALQDDLNIAEALSALFNFVRDINSLIDQQKVSESTAKEILEALEQFNQVLGILEFKAQEVEIPAEVQEAFRQRQEARANRDFKMADHYRDLIHEKGYVIEDSPQGSKLKKA